MFQRSKTSKPRLAALASIAGGLAGGVAAVTRRRVKAGAAADRREGPATWSCECGQEFRVSGQDRHRVYWLRDADPGDPVVGGRCPNCERPLPGEHVIDEKDEKDETGEDAAKGEQDAKEEERA